MHFFSRQSLSTYHFPLKKKVSHTTVQTLASWQHFFHHVLHFLESQCCHPVALTWCVSDIWPRTDTVLIVNVHQCGPQSHHSFSFAHSAGVQVCRNNNRKKKKSLCKQNLCCSCKPSVQNYQQFFQEDVPTCTGEVSLWHHEGPAYWPASLYFKNVEAELVTCSRDQVWRAFHGV